MMCVILNNDVLNFLGLSPQTQMSQPIIINARAAPEVPTEPITTGRLVKISDGNERFWVEVERVENDTIIGTMQNELLFNTPYCEIGTRVQFEKKHILIVEAADNVTKQLYAWLALMAAKEA